MSESHRMPRRISADEELRFMQANRDRLRTHFLTPEKIAWADTWGHSRAEFEEIVTTVLSMDQRQIRELRQENRGKNPLKGARETQIQLLHSIDLFITGVLNFPEE
ncbi:MAG: hypothetical protein ACOY3M_03065 [Patescibacteria group bacterium]